MRLTLIRDQYVPPSSLYLDQKLEMMLANADKPSSRIIDDCDLNRLFGIIR